MSDDRELLEPCPFCGAGETDIVENGKVWLGMKYSEPASVSVRHFCTPIAGQPSRMLERVGRDRESAIAAWNRRAPVSRLEAAAATEYERGRQDGMKQEHALWQMQRIGQEIEAAAVPELSREDVVRLAREAGFGVGHAEAAITLFQRFASLVRSVPVGEVKPGVWPDSVSDTVLQTPEPDRWLDAEPRPVPMFHMATLMQYGERCAEAGMSAVTRAVKPAPDVGDVKPVAWMYTLFGRSGEVAHREASVVNWDERYQPFGRPGIDFHEEGIVRKEPLFTTPPAPPEGWRPIETAPKDGSCVLVYVKGDSLYPTAAHYCSREYWEKEYGDPQYMEEGWYWAFGYPSDFHESVINPTHWMPLPAAPQPGDKT